MQTWVDVPPTPGRWPRSTQPHLRIITERNGYLNRLARQFLFDGEKSGWVWFQRAEGQPWSIVRRPEGEGVPVSSEGRLTVTALTRTAGGAIPVTILLHALPAVDGGERRLIFAGVKP